MTKLTDLTEEERNVLYMLEPYEDGVEIDPDRFKPEVLATLRDMIAKGYCSEEARDNGLSHFRLTAEGQTITDP